MRREYKVKEKITCDVCKKNMTKQSETEGYHILGDQFHKTIRFGISHSGGDICTECTAKALLFCIIRRWNIADKIYELFRTKTDKLGMDTFIKKIMFPKWKWGATEWIHWECIKKKS